MDPLNVLSLVSYSFNYQSFLFETLNKSNVFRFRKMRQLFGLYPERSMEVIQKLLKEKPELQRPFIHTFKQLFVNEWHMSQSLIFINQLHHHHQFIYVDQQECLAVIKDQKLSKLPYLKMIQLFDALEATNQWEIIRIQMNENRENFFIIRMNKKSIVIPTHVLKVLSVYSPPIKHLFQPYVLNFNKGHTLKIYGWAAEWLMIKSSYFKGLWSGRFNENAQHVHFLDLSSEEFKLIFNDSLGQKFMITRETILRWLEIGDQYDFPSIVKECQKWVNNYFNIYSSREDTLSYMLELMSQAHRRNMRALETTCQEGLTQYLSSIQTTEEFKNVILQIKNYQKNFYPVYLDRVYLVSNKGLNWLIFLDGLLFKHLIINQENFVQKKEVIWIPAVVKKLTLIECEIGHKTLLTLFLAHLDSLDLIRCEHLKCPGFRQFFAFSTSLTSLTLKDCYHLTDGDIFKFPIQLKQIIIQRCMFLTSQTFTDCPPQLEVLHLISCQISGEFFKDLAPSLRSLHLNECIIFLNQELNLLNSQITDLNLSNCSQLTDLGLSLLPIHLKTLDLSFTRIKTANLKYLSVLEELNLAYCLKLTPELLKNLPGSMIKLNLSGCRLTDQMLALLPRNLKELNLGECSLLTGATIDQLPDTIQYLDLSDCYKLKETPSQWPSQLQILILKNCHQLTDKMLKNLPKGLKELNLLSCQLVKGENSSYFPDSLKKLFLLNCQHIENRYLQYLPPFLKVLDLKNCFQINKIGLKLLPMMLKKLSLSGCQNIKDKHLKLLPHSLQDLRLASCQRITGIGFKHLPPYLLALDLRDCENLMSDELYHHSLEKICFS